MPYMYSEMQNKLSKTRKSPLESMGQIISSRCPILKVQVSSPYNIIIIITLFQEDNIFGRVASLTYGPQLTNVGMILLK